MDQQTWSGMTSAQKEAQRDNSGLSPQLIGLEGWRVEVVTTYGEKRRFYVGKSTGWRPCHLEVKLSNSHGGTAAEQVYASVTRLNRRR